MSFTEDALRAKLSALNETQDSIVTVAQWIMFHRRKADKTVQLWLERLKESTPAKRVNLIYLANEVAQQSKARRKDDFINAFSPVMPEAVEVTVKGATNDLQTKVRRTIEVWRQRQVFDLPVQDAMEARIAEADKQRPTSTKKSLGGALFASDSSLPVEFQALLATQQSLSKVHLNMTPLVQTAQNDHASLTTSPDPSKPPRVHAAQLGAVVKALANAENAVSESLIKRRELISGLENFLEANRKTLAEEEATHISLKGQREENETQRRKVEESILADGGENGTQAATDATNVGNVERPELEGFTPPVVEPLSPPPAPMPEAEPPAVDAEKTDYMQSTTPTGTPPPLTAMFHSPGDVNDAAGGTESGSAPYMSPDGTNTSSTSYSAADPRRQKDTTVVTVSSAIPPNLNPVNGSKPSGSQDSGSPRGVKRRRKSGDDDFERIGFGAGEDALEGLDEEVVGMLG